MSNNNHEEQHLFSVKFYVKIFFILLVMIFMNMGISKLPLPNEWVTFLLLVVATTQAVIVSLFFMELIHEDKFYSFIWAGAILFMVLFFIITLFELNGRGAFDKMEDIHYMRSIDLNNNYAPSGPEMQQKSSPSPSVEEKK
ncbi:MAG: cytochrome C oxidase subunit IV family protein [Bdellovibrionota bacterium]